MASTCFGSISSIDSYISLAQPPIDRTPIAMVPANTPGPTITTKRSAQINEFTDRVATIMNSITARTDLCGVVL